MALVKIFRVAEWQAFLDAGSFAGSEDDRRDGFLHLSTVEQLEGTLSKHFVGAGKVVIAELDLAGDPALRFEQSRSGALFPHLYRPLRRQDVVRHEDRNI